MKMANHENIDEKPETYRQMVSYFDHEFERPTLQKIDADITEMLENGFTHVVLTMSESDIRSPQRMQVIETFMTEARARGLKVIIDFWNFAHMTGGEAYSFHQESGEPSCICNKKARDLTYRGLGKAAEVGADTVMWDEPEMRCPDHKGQGYELPYIEQFTEAANQLNLANVVVLPTDWHRRQQFIDIASLPYVDELGDDSYFECVFDKRITEENRLAYVWDWNSYTKRVADWAGKRSHGWIQNFWIPQGREAMIGEHIVTVKRAVGDIAIWGFHGCESIAEHVPKFYRPGTLSPMQHWQATLQSLAELREEEGELVA